MHVLLILVVVSSVLSSSKPEPDPLVAHYPAAPIDYCTNGGVCVPPVICSVHYLQALYDPSSACLVAEGTPGLCCPPISKRPYSKRRLLKKARNPPGSKSPLKFDTYTLNHAALVGQSEVAWLVDFEKELSRRKVFVSKGSAAFSHNAFFKLRPGARKSSDFSSIGIFGSQDLADRFSLTPNQAGFGLTAFSVRDTSLADQCPAGGRCDPKARYRSADASCNNLDNSLWGKAGTPFQRTLLPEYSDGVWRPRVAKSGGPLPSARLVSINVIPDVDAPSELETHNVMQWGQFVDHDLTHTPLFRLSDGSSSGIQCCEEDGSAPVSRLVLHPECFPIDIPINDPFFRRHNQRCMNFVRSMPGPNQECSFGYGEQMNQITHLQDASNVYGSDEEENRELREYRGGLLRTYSRGGAAEKGLLPQEEGEAEAEECEIPSFKQRSQDRRCFKAGDSRSNEQPGLTAYHTVWMREHNRQVELRIHLTKDYIAHCRLARELAYLNPHWEDEQLYQEARRILIAEMQHITYNEWLPVVIGTDFMAELDILPLTHGLSTKYNAKINPTILNSFATAAFRFGHTLVQGLLDLVEEAPVQRRRVRAVPLSEQFFNPELVYTPGGLDRFLVGLASQPSQHFDNIMSDQLTNHLFQGSNKSFGMDLAALNIQRGRDHGLPGYNSFRELCGLGRVPHFDYMVDYIPYEIVERLKMIYEDVDDVDLFIGGISESNTVGSLLGPTFQCIVGDQFARLNHGDRFFYESAASPAPFTEVQLGELRKASLARITCDNGDNINSIQPLAFRTPTLINPVVPCDAITIPIVDLTAWKEDAGKVVEPLSSNAFPTSPIFPTPGFTLRQQPFLHRWREAKYEIFSEFNHFRQPKVSPVFHKKNKVTPFVHHQNLNSHNHHNLHSFNLNLRYG